MLRDFTPRLYQQTILGTASRYNTLVVLPTGLGKTGIALLMTTQRLSQYPQSKVLMLAPTKPLCEQHVETFRKHFDLPAEKIVLFTGSVPPEKRAQLWQQATIVISTPQGLENDTINQRVQLEDVSLLIIDECHHATGEYSYVWLAQQYNKLASHARIVALTASPGSDMEAIKEVCKNLIIEKVEVRTDEDPDVKSYIQKTKINWLAVEFPLELKKIQKNLLDCKKKKMQELLVLGFTSSVDLSKMELLTIQNELHKKISLGEKDMESLRSISLLAEVLKLEHGLELLETQGLKPLHKYLQKMQQEAITTKVKAVKNLVQEEHFKASLYYSKQLVEQGFRHPKLTKLKEILQPLLANNPAAKIIVFTQYRDSADIIMQELAQDNIKNHLFFGQAKKEGRGFSQKQQKEILDKFRTGEFNVLIATSVAEEGLDIPRVDEVIFYEPIPSAIRSIQRRGRTGRLERGEVTILVTKNTRDEIYRWSSHHKEKRMHHNLAALRQNFTLLQQEIAPQPTLERFIPQEQMTTILADHREKDNRIVKELIDLGVSVRTAQLEAADYILSGRVAVELKQIPDFVASIIDGRLLEQLRDLKKYFERSVVIIEGEEDIYSVRKVHANAIRGMLSSIVLDFGIPVLYTKNPRDTAALLAVMAKREQEKSRDISLHDRKPLTIQQQQEFIVSSFPNVGQKTAQALLLNQKTIKNIINASKEELQKIPGVGEKIAERLVALFEQEYGEES